MSSVHDTKAIVYIDSSKRALGTDGSFSINVSYNTRVPYDRVALMAANIPKTYYAIPQGRNTFVLTEGVTSITVVVAVGTYTRQGFATYLGARLTALSPSGWTYAVSLPNTSIGPETGYYTYTVTGSGGVQPTFTFGTSMGQQMGFDPNTTYAFTGGALVSVNVTNLAAETSLYLKSNLVSDFNSQNNILQDIYTNLYAYNSYIYYQNPNVEFNSKPFLNPGNAWEFWLCDEDGNVLDLNGCNMVLTVCLFREPLVDRLVERYILLKTHGAQLVDLDEDEDPHQVEGA